MLDISSLPEIMPESDLPDILKKPIRTIEQAKRWIEALHAADLMFHFEDSPDDIGNLIDGAAWQRTFSDVQAATIARQRDRLYRFDWGSFDCPIGYALHLIGHQMED
jgi:hypothetical protein